MNIRKIEDDARQVLHQPIGEKTKWIVITGAPSAGKTTILQELNIRGFKTSPDISREHLEYLLSLNGDKFDIRRDEAAVQQEILWKMLLAESRLPVSETIFLEYALPDNLPFWDVGNIPLTGDVWRAAVRFRYRHILIFDSLPFVDDNIRTGSDAKQSQIIEKQKMYYSALGYQWVSVPVAPIKERASIVLNLLEATA